MDRKTALELFDSFEKERFTEMEGDPPVYDVRLDATMDSSFDRVYRVRITPGGLGLDRDNWLFVNEEAARLDVEMKIQNSGIELV